MSINIKVKPFIELTNTELYKILQLRSEVFVIEQNCVYQDIDDNDIKALHVLGVKNNNIIAYTRIFKPADYFDLASIGRVVVAKNERSFGYGYDIVNASIKAIENNFNVKKIKISAQLYLKDFYNKCGFLEIGETYLEDGIPHVVMIK